LGDTEVRSRLSEGSLVGSADLEQPAETRQKSILIVHFSYFCSMKFVEEIRYRVVNLNEPKRLEVGIGFLGT
jgi:hypothetical protein